MKTTKKITRSTLKSFIRKNKGKLFVKIESSFDGMVDCVMPIEDSFTPANEDTSRPEYSLGISGLHLVGSSRDYFDPYDDGQYEGIEIWNSCGSSILAVKKEA